MIRKQKIPLNLKVRRFSFKSLRFETVFSYQEPDMTSYNWTFFLNFEPKYYFSYYDENYNKFYDINIAPIEEQHGLSHFRILDFLAKKLNNKLSVYNSSFSIKKIIKPTEWREVDYFPLQEIWENLSEKEIDLMILKTKKKWYEA